VTARRWLGGPGPCPSGERGPPGAEWFAREAIKPVPDDMLNLRAILLVGLAEILRAAGRHDQAQPVSAEAVQLYERKRNLVAAQACGKQA
jgi:hypothetical protein